MNRSPSKILPICLCAVLASLSFVMTFINIRLPLPGNGGLVHLGNIPVVIAAIVLGKKYGAVTGALGMTLFDIMGGWLLWAPFTFLIRLAVGFAIGFFAKKRAGKSIAYKLLGILVGGVILISGYYAAEWIIYGNPFAPVASIPGNVLQIISMLVLGVPLAAAIEKALPKRN